MISNNEREREQLLREVVMDGNQLIIGGISVTKQNTRMELVPESTTIIVERIPKKKQPFIIEKDAPEWVKVAFESVYDVKEEE